MPRPSALGLLALSTSLLALYVKAQTIQAGPNTDYLLSMCYPLLSNTTRSSEISATEGYRGPALTLSQSPFPCEQMNYLVFVCRANGTTPIDFAAEQQCLCNGNYFAAITSCADCYRAHGTSTGGDLDSWDSQVSSMSSAECGPATPTQAFSNLLVHSTAPPSQYTTLDMSYATSADRLRSQTAVSAYYTGGVPTPGSITGDATARATVSTDSKSTSPTTGVPTTTTSGAGDAASTTASTAAAARRTAAGGLAAVVLGAAMIL